MAVALETEETEEMEDDDQFSGDAPAAKGLPHKAQKARVIVKRNSHGRHRLL